MDEVTTAWAAGLFEGEGCLTLRRSGRSAVMMISMTDLDVLERWHAWAECGSVTVRNRPSAPAHHKQQWCWQVGGWEDIVRLIDALLPHMLERRSARMIEVRSAIVREPGMCRNRRHLLATVGTTANGTNGNRTCAGCKAERDARRVRR